MRNKLKKLIIGCIAVTAVLLLTQGYFIYNTYLLYERQTYSEIRNEVGKLEHSLNSDSIRYAWMSELKNRAATGSLALFTEEWRVPYSKTISDRVNLFIVGNNLLRKHEVKYFNSISRASVTFANYGPQVVENVLWYGHSDTINRVNLLNTYTLSSGAISSPYGNLTAELDTQSGFTINNLGKSVLPKLIAILVFSFLLLLTLVYVFYVAIRNILKQKRIADAKTDFVNNITHEFNTPLAALNVSLSALKSKNEIMNDALTRISVSTIERQYTRLKDLVSHATHHSFTEGDIVLNKTQVTNQQFLTDVVSDFVHTHPEVRVFYSPTHAPVKLMIDQFRFTTAINNLLDNAAKYGKKEIEVRSFIENNIYKISVTDNGPGIPKERRDLIFEKFARLESGNIHTVKGLGLGLYYAKQIVHAHMGGIAVMNGQNGGANFTISIQLA